MSEEIGFCNGGTHDFHVLYLSYLELTTMTRYDKSGQWNGRQDPAAFRAQMCCMGKQTHKLEAKSAGWMPLTEPGVQEITACDSKVASTAAVQTSYAQIKELFLSMRMMAVQGQGESQILSSLPSSAWDVLIWKRSKLISLMSGSTYVHNPKDLFWCWQ